MDINIANIQLKSLPTNANPMALSEAKSKGHGGQKNTEEIYAILQNDLEQYEGSSRDMERYSVEFDDVSWRESYADDQWGAQKALVEWTILGSAKAYADIFDKISNSDLDKVQRSEAVKWLDTSYKAEVGSKIKYITAEFNNYFDSGNRLLQTFSKNILEDLFDSDVFTNHIADMALQSKRIYMAGDKTAEDSDVIASLNTEFSEASSPEKMTISDMSQLLGFVNMKRDLFDGNTVSQIDLGKSIANREKEIMGQIKKLGLSKSLYESVKSVEKRRSEGLMRQGAYVEEVENYNSTKDMLQEEYNRFLERLRIFEMQIKKLKEANGIDPSNDQLFGILTRQLDVEKNLQDIKKQMFENEKSHDALEKDKSTIVEKESYSRIKASYDKTLQQ